MYVRDHWAGILDKLGVKIIPYARLFGVDDTSAYFQHVTSGEPIIVDEVDTVVTSLGHTAVNGLAAELADWNGELHEIGDCLASEQISPDRITMEITENLLMSDPEAATALLEALKRLGLKIAVDDFGTGYSSLSYLHRFPIDTIKIDKSFIDTMIGNRKSFGIVEILTKLARNLGMDVVAEGIEASEQVETLRRFTCNYGQGFLFSRPLPEDKASELLRADPDWKNPSTVQ